MKSPPREPTIARGSIRILRPLVLYLTALGHAPDLIQATLGADVATIMLGEERIPRQTLFDAFRRAEELTGTSGLGLRMAELIDLRSAGRGAMMADYPLVQLLVTSSTVGEGLALIGRYFEIASEGVSLVIAYEGARVGIRLVARGEPPPSPAFVEFMLGWIVNGVRRLAATPVSLDDVRFTRERPASTAEYERVLGVTPRFAAGEDAFFIRYEDLAAPIRESAPTLLDAVVKRADEQLAQIAPPASLADRVAAMIAAELRVGRPSVSRVARSLGLSVRTLARRLDEEGTSYTKLLEGLRAALARKYLFEERLPVSETSRRLRFANLRTFRRAFRQWYGQSPVEFVLAAERAQAGERQDRRASV